MIFVKFLPQMYWVSVDKQELIKVWKSSASECWSTNFWSTSQHCEMGICPL